MTFVDPATAPPEGVTPAQKSAIAVINDNLSKLGLPASLGSWAWTQIQAGADPTQVMLDMQDTREFKERFPAIAQLRERASRGENVRIPTPGEYVQFEETATAVMRQAGLPEGFYDQPSDFTNLIVGQVSPAELQLRIRDGYQKVADAPADVRAQLKEFYGVDEGGLAAYFLDPNVDPNMLTRRAAAAGIGAAAGRTAYGGISATEAERLVSAGLSADQAGTGFGLLARQNELFGALPGEAGTPTVSRASQLETLVAPQGAAAMTVEETARRRKAAFEGGGRFATGQGGVSGLSRGG